MKNKKNISLKKFKINQKNSIRSLSSENIKQEKIKILKPSNLKKPNVAHRPTSALENQNMNNFSHLFKNSQNTNIDILWTLNLRQPDNIKKKFKKNSEKINLIKEPSFYQEDLEKYVKKEMKKSKSAFEIALPSLSKYPYLIKNKLSDTHGTILNNKDLLYYELTLRKNNFKDNKSIGNGNNIKEEKDIKKPKWNNSIYKENSKDLITINYNLNMSNDKSNWLEEKLVNRPYKVILKKMRYDDNSNIFKRLYVKDKEKAYNKLGEIFSFKPYNDKYTEKNYNNIENLLNSNNKSQQNIWFQLSLRNNDKHNKKNSSQKY